MDATAALVREPNGSFQFDTVTIDQPRPDEVLVRVRAVGICHTDIVTASGALGTPFPAVLGHEGAGVVEAVGSAVTKVKPGDKVLITFNYCGVCARCAGGDPAYCESFNALNFGCCRADGSGTLHQHGTKIGSNYFGQSSFATLALANERNVVKVAADADLATLAPLGCGVQTGVGGVVRSLAAKPGSSLLVIGGGAVGLSAVIGGVLAGCSTIVLLEPRPERRELALTIGAHHAIDPKAGDAAAAVRAILPKGVDNIIDTSGNAGAITTAATTLAAKGSLGLIGVPNPMDAVLTLSILNILLVGMTVKGITEGDSVPDEFLPQLVAWQREGRLPIDRFIKTYPFAKINEAIADSHHGHAIKAVLVLD
jgi:aryl-alcohol dehydrogenase